ncbi:response regulator [Cohnella rhizosphaerae]|uniref:Response regulator n=1 Tax=Cohnella rhizosphaerae TaxID=1457232 RepID=A0A9X4QUL3_9BACL|nr:response regulator [Cohnella rhizosphaerae]MDG0811619.1 response regulator [Cohnella rhizosphaerae]
MRSVMIVDDESLVRIGLQSMIDWEAHGFRIAGVFKNGEEALAACAQQAFDVVLTDIRMPGMDGFELIRGLRTAAPAARVVILSSYNDFEHTRQAIRLGVQDYISKYEMEPEELLRVLGGLEFEAAEETEARGNVGEPDGGGEAALANESRLLLERTDVRAAAAVEAPPADAAACPALAVALAGRGRLFRWAALKPVPREGGYAAAERRAMLHLAEELFARLRLPVLFGESEDMLHGGYACEEAAAVPASPEAGGATASMSVDANADLKKAADVKAVVKGGVKAVPVAADLAADRESAARMAREWAAAFQQKLNVTLAIGFSAPQDIGGDWTAARRGAEAAAAVALFEGGVRFRETAGELGAIPDAEWLALYKSFKQRLRLLQPGALADDLLALRAERGERYKPAEWIRLGVAAVSQLADFLIERYNPAPEELRERFGPLWPFAEAAGSVRTAEEWRRTIGAIAAKSAELVARKQARDGWVARVRDYVEAHYADPIRLEDMAQLAGFSENHFGQRFRQETGKSFSDHLTDVRIKEAVRLFRETELSTEEIASRVGYANPNYFVKVFKRATGQTISHFKGRR